MPLLLSLSMPGTRELFGYGVVALSAIFFVVDPIAVVPVFITITEGDSAHKRKQMALRACIVTAGILLTFLIAGGLIFKLFSLTLAAFRIAGGLLLSLTGLDMLRSVTSATKTSDKEVTEAVKKPDVAIVPLAMPLLAGPGSIATVMVLVAQAKHFWQVVILGVAIVITAAASYLMLRAASLVNRILGASGRAILERVMGLLLVAIAVQFIIGGVRDAFPEIFVGR
ncbi:MAG TPA: MarC family protein [Pseudomonadota bacterium]|jgi:multiple antibiotic resistance protein|nr:MarC family protein [Pseudomonadota bacterium]HNF96969.1 MarC family protein [Pseudomonadota bacterium]HNK44396.1 MarC family protein [Pseudomonadota bacterium]HNN53144.1 MarC family protein [Pseudomonadota bacterium]HNO69092.1 MarC family protein [Pseudomonadota bacterium]